VTRWWRDESGQALVFSALVLGLLLLLLAFGMIGLGLLASARAALGKAADAAALAVLGQSTIGATLTVSYADYTCQGADGSVTCSVTPGQTDVPVSDAGAFTTSPGGAFGPIPGWAAAAGCMGTQWPRSVDVAGRYRICTGQRLASASVSAADPAILQRAAQAWLEANVRGDGQLYGARVRAITVGTDGQVTVVATARVRPGLLMFDRTSVAETAWPGL